VSAPAAIDVQTVPVVAAQTLPTASVVAESRALPILLVVDDEPLIGDMLEMGLSREFMVELAGGVGPALERLRRSPTPDLVLCDMIMPGGGGPALIQALESEGGPLPPVVFMSGGAATSVAREFLRIRGIVPIEKPFRIQDVRQRLHAVFNRR
jgi:DNA-binding NtrC family response regulator